MNGFGHLEGVKQQPLSLGDLLKSTRFFWFWTTNTKKIWVTLGSLNPNFRATRTGINGNMAGSKMGAPDWVDVWTPLKMRIFQPAMSVYQRVTANLATKNRPFDAKRRVINYIVFQTMIFFSGDFVLLVSGRVFLLPFFFGGNQKLAVVGSALCLKSFWLVLKDGTLRWKMSWNGRKCEIEVAKMEKNGKPWCFKSFSGTVSNIFESPVILLMAEIPNNHLGCKKPL